MPLSNIPNSRGEGNKFSLYYRNPSWTRNKGHKLPNASLNWKYQDKAASNPFIGLCTNSFVLPYVGQEGHDTTRVLSSCFFWLVGCGAKGEEGRFASLLSLRDRSLRWSIWDCESACRTEATVWERDRGHVSYQEATYRRWNNGLFVWDDKNGFRWIFKVWFIYFPSVKS